jgi:hypothetical protein
VASRSTWWSVEAKLPTDLSGELDSVSQRLKPSRAGCQVRADGGHGHDHGAHGDEFAGIKLGAGLSLRVHLQEIVTDLDPPVGQAGLQNRDLG